MPEAAVAVLVLPNKQVVLQRKDSGAPISPSMLALFGGQIEDGESPTEAIKREISEETSLEPDSLKPKKLFTHKSLVKSDLQRPAVLFHVFRLDIPSSKFKV